VRAEGSDAEPVWVHNASYADPSVQTQIAAEVRLNQSEFALADTKHFELANEGLAQVIESDTSVESYYRKAYGDEFTDAALEGETPEGWTWHHALRAQANGEAGWMQLVPTEYHRSNFGLFHPEGFGGYQEWAVPAGAPRPR
jgi:hypothetical protein